jgi:Flp pilus assembly protein TadD
MSATARATALLEIGRTTDAIPLLESAVVADPEDPRPRCMLAAALLEAGNTKAAVTTAESAIALDPELEWPHRVRALALLATRRKKQALESAREAVALEPELPETHIVLARAEQANHRLPAARAAAERAVELDPESSDAHDEVGRVAMEQKDLTTAERSFRTALKLDPEDPIAMNNLGIVLEKTGRRGDALKLLEGAVRTDPRQDLSRENTVKTARDVLTGGGWLIPIVLFIAFRAIRVAKDAGVPIAVSAALVLVAGLAAIVIFERVRMRQLSPTARALIIDERRRARRKPWTWRPQYIYLPWPIVVARLLPAPIWLVACLAGLVLSAVNYGAIGSGAAAIVAGFALLAALAAWRTQRWLLRRGWL